MMILRQWQWLGLGRRRWLGPEQGTLALPAVLNWDSPYPPDGTMYVENRGTPPTPEIASRRSFYFGAKQSVLSSEQQPKVGVLTVGGETGVST
ncbi:hypothetical protein GN244_ATG18823 [Phytophthora infestans]|uniref:Uncharacterized protein n=1 Tax=Phytophthora infestans TaxID=4787 RepID=A0A833SQH6_PHYIN|nr:hypothetical protein GN244_ATG18823 [Phytophthora infestans]